MEDMRPELVLLLPWLSLATACDSTGVDIPSTDATEDVDSVLDTVADTAVDPVVDTAVDPVVDTVMDPVVDTAVDDAGVDCFPPEIDCGGVCVDPYEDPDHCGGCGGACPLSRSCEEGACVDECSEGLEDCARSCVDLRFHLEHCGACFNACPTGQVCGHLVCTSEVCTPGEVYCFGHCTTLATDISNCGECGNACDIYTERCEDGVCVPA
jgi:hypothetical protein